MFINLLKNKKKEKRILHTRKMPILDENGNPKYLLGISEDITDRINAQKEIEKLSKVLSSIQNLYYKKKEQLDTIKGGEIKYYEKHPGPEE
mgnify:CR=1 FL=1